jgi:cytochrome c biogenesis protein CcmG/thiol:disulfide interchange protein DsbE
MAHGARRLGQAAAIAVVLALLAVLVWRVVRNRDAGAAAALRRGEHPTAPNFTLSRLDRSGTLELASLRGKAVVLNFWASWCLPCKKEAPLLEQAWRKWRSKGVTIVGVDANDLKSDARSFAARYKLSYPLVHDGPGNWLDDYGLTGFPETFFVRPDGKLSSWTQGELDAGEIETGIREALSS